jgi:hypothetical protein
MDTIKERKQILSLWKYENNFEYVPRAMAGFFATPQELRISFT